VFRDGPEGAVMAEVAEDDPARTLSLAPGRYFVRGRAAEHLLEGQTTVEPARLTRLDPGALTRIEYAHLVRKGHATLPRTHAVELLAHARSALPNAETPCFGARGGYRLDTAALAWLVRAGFCSSSRDGAALSVTTHEFDLGMRVVHAFDLGSRVSLEAGGGASLAYFVQSFDTRRRAPTRRTLAGLTELVLGLGVDISHGTYATLDLALQAYLLPMFDEDGRDTRVEPALSGQLGLGAGARF
jgi:hypothetical protein